MKLRLTLSPEDVTKAVHGLRMMGFSHRLHMVRLGNDMRDGDMSAVRYLVNKLLVPPAALPIVFEMFGIQVSTFLHSPCFRALPSLYIPPSACLLLLTHIRLAAASPPSAVSTSAGGTSPGGIKHAAFAVTGPART